MLENAYALWQCYKQRQSLFRSANLSLTPQDALRAASGKEVLMQANFSITPLQHTALSAEASQAWLGDADVDHG